MKQNSLKNRASITVVLSHLMLLAPPVSEAAKSEQGIQNGSTSALNSERVENGSTSAL